MAKLTFRAARADEASLASDLMTASLPRDPSDPVMLADHWAHPRTGMTHGRFIAELSDTPIAYVEWQHGAWEELPERNSWVEVYLDPAHKDEQLLTSLYEWVAREGQREGAWTLNASAGEDEPEVIRVLGRLGYQQDRADRLWELDLRAAASRLTADAAAARDRMQSAGITITTLAGWDDPDRFEKLYELHELTRHDVPHSTPVLAQTVDDFMAKVHAPGVIHDRFWLALDKGAPIANSYLVFPPVRGPVWTAYTCSHRDYRGRGIARAVKLQSLAQAVELGLPAVRTDNDSENAAMLHINESLGYRPLPGYTNFVKRLRKTALR